MSVLFKQFNDFKYVEGTDTFGSLDALFELQLGLMEAMGAGKFPRDLYFLLTVQNLQGEAIEASEFWGDATKPWKEKYEFDVNAVKEEWIDVLFFWVQGAIALGMNADEVLEIYSLKHSKNLQRIAEKMGTNEANQPV